MDVKRFQKSYDTIVDNVNLVIHGKDDVVRLCLAAICANGHVLFEDVPGVGKSMMAIAFSRSMDAQNSRIQCTPDMLPGDITGSSIIDTKTMKFTFQPGPVFTNILLVDEINRATPKTQSALLEAMGERHVSTDGVTRRLPDPFLVLATQNPVELAGTFPLPEAQLDRFLFKLTMGYPDKTAEKRVMAGNAVGLEVETLDSVISTKDVLAMQRIAAEVEVSNAIQDYIVDITHATREDPGVILGAGPRASISLLKASKVMAAADGRDSVYAEDVKAILRSTLAHRLMLAPDATLRGETVDDVLERVTNKIKPPVGVSDSLARKTTVSADNGNGSRTGRRAARAKSRA
ncbi:MAG TPA: MoxR family ATPase [Acidimicrobiales bacterium]|nr:MoxR family ATPase [Acidimicrobiales bacterium]